MRWLIAGLSFALAVVLAIGTAAIRADNTRMRHAIERTYRAIEDRIVEYRQLSLRRLDAASPQRLAEQHWASLDRAAELAAERLQ